jgi:hypothetical protein
MKQILWLIQNGVAFDVALALSRDEASALCDILLKVKLHG